MRRRFAAILATVTTLSLMPNAFALIYLSENTLESMLIRSDGILIAKVAEVSERDNKAVVEVIDALKGDLKGKVTLTGVMLRVTTKESRRRFDVGDRAILFLNKGEDSRPILHSYKLESDAEVKTMKACVLEVTPFAQVLSDLAARGKTPDEKEVRRALSKLVASENAYTQILVGRLMGTRLAEQIKPEGWEDILLPGLESKRKELTHGALIWSHKYQKLPANIRAAVKGITAKSDKDLAKEARELLGSFPE